MNMLDKLDDSKKDNEDAAELFDMLTAEFPATGQPYGKDGGLMITEIRRATTLRCRTSDRERERIGSKCSEETNTKCAGST